MILTLKKILLAIAVVGSLSCFTGCETADKDESNLPWSRPANWEGQAPGMGNQPGRDRY